MIHFEDFVSSQEQNLTYVTVIIDKISVNPYMNLLGDENLLISIKSKIVLVQISITR